MEKEKIVEYVRYLVKKDLESECGCDELGIYCENYEGIHDCFTPEGECAKCWERTMNKITETIINGGLTTPNQKSIM